MNKCCLLLALISTLSLNGMFEPAKKEILDAYKAAAMRTWQPATHAYFEKYPYTPESLILMRYIHEFSNAADRYKNRILEGESESELARDLVPGGSGQLEYILTGRKPCATTEGCCVAEWNAKLKEIEEAIQQKMQG